jgi:hypothetical protein
VLLRPDPMRALLFALVAASAVGGCVGAIGGDDARQDPKDADTNEASVVVPKTPVEHLSTREYARAVEHLTGHVLSPGDLQLYQAGEVSNASHYVFDRDTSAQGPSPGFVDGAHDLAMRVAEAVTSDEARLEAILPCTPEGVSDAACLSDFVSTVGRRALRRPMAPSEVDAIVAGALRFASDPPPGESAAFRYAVEIALAALLEHPEFLHKVEVGTPEEGTDRYLLGDFEIAARLGFALWGSVPDDELLDAAASGALRAPEQVEAQAIRMLADPKAREQVESFYAQWLGFATPDLPITTGMRREARALVERVVFDENAPWDDVFTTKETFVDAELASAYGLEAPLSPDEDGFGWVAYDDDRAGILSSGAMLVGSGQEPSLARRGLRIRDRLLCVELELPEDSLEIDVDAVNDPANGPCKADRSKRHREDGACAYCHEQFDPIGQGLDGYDTMGRPREYEQDIIPEDGIECPVDTAGSITMDGEAMAFSGPGELGGHLAGSEDLAACFADRYFTFVVGRAPEAEDEALLLELRAVLAEQNGDLLAFVRAWVKSDAFRYRRVASGS